MVRLRGSGPRDPGSNPGGPIKLRKTWRWKRVFETLNNLTFIGLALLAMLLAVTYQLLSMRKS